MIHRPFVSIIIPCRNEEKYLVNCLDSVLAQDYLFNCFELLLADGMSEDKTRLIMEDYTRRYPNVHWFENPKKILPTGLNILISKAKGEIIIRLDAHSHFPSNYISKCVKYLNEYNVDSVGGFLETRVGADTVVAKAIVVALTSLFGVGGSRFRLGIRKPVLVESVPFACYRRDVFDRVGLFNEKMMRNEDVEFNTRLKKAGGKILLHPEINSVYFARPDILSAIRQKFQDGFWCVYGMKFAKVRAFFPRHLIPMIFVACLTFSFILGIWLKPFLWLGLGVLGFYSLANIFTSVFVSVKYGFIYFPFLMVIFSSLHFSYGIGSLCGILRLISEGLIRKR